MIPTPTLLSISDVSVDMRTREHQNVVLHEVGLQVFTGEVVGLLGESGAGKSMTLRAILDLLPPNAKRVGGDMWFRGQSYAHDGARRWASLRGRGIALVPSNSKASLHPMKTVGAQLRKVLEELGKPNAPSDEINRALSQTGLNESRIPGLYPHQLSGGMAQRVTIAMALLCHPGLLLADEPTSGLDITVQRQVLDLLRGLSEQTGVGILLVTHDPGVVAQYCQRVYVLSSGVIVEQGPVRDVLRRSGGWSAVYELHGKAEALEGSNSK